MPHYMTVHYERLVAKEEMERRWVEMAKERRAYWIKTWYNVQEGKRYCWWDAPKKDVLKEVFKYYHVPYDEIIEVELTTPADWRWRED